VIRSGVYISKYSSSLTSKIVGRAFLGAIFVFFFLDVLGGSGGATSIYAIAFFYSCNRRPVMILLALSLPNYERSEQMTHYKNTKLNSNCTEVNTAKYNPNLMRADNGTISENVIRKYTVIQMHHSLKRSRIF